MTRRLLLAVLSAAALSAGCLDFLKSATSPTTTAFSAATLNGAWASVVTSGAGGGTNTSPCTDFKWTVTSITGTTAAGTFTATCGGYAQINGTATGTFSGTDSVAWTANATATAPGFPSCAIALTGTATIEATNQIRIPYSGTTCLGPISGTELLRKT